MIEFKDRGVKISSVVISTIFGHAGNGMFPYVFFPAYRRMLSLAKTTQTTVLTKSSTKFKRKGNYIWWNPRTWKYIQKIFPNGLLNAYGLTNDGVRQNACEIALSFYERFKVIPNYFPKLSKESDLMEDDITKGIMIYRNYLGKNFKFLELNFSCPNTKDDIRKNTKQAILCVKIVKELYPDLILIAKISIVHPFEFAQELEQAGADVIHAINTIPCNMLYPGPCRQSPLHKVGGGGVSGGPAFKMAFDYNSALRKQVKLPMIMGCGIMSVSDTEKYFDIGADSISICTLLSYDCEEAGRIIKKYNM